MDTPPIICISPEDIGKVPSHAIWVLGFASNTWKKKDKDHYLLADELSSHADIDMTARLSFGAWGVSHSNLLGCPLQRPLMIKPIIPWEFLMPLKLKLPSR